MVRAGFGLTHDKITCLDSLHMQCSDNIGWVKSDQPETFPSSCCRFFFNFWSILLSACLADAFGQKYNVRTIVIITFHPFLYHIIVKKDNDKD